jgi:UDP-galactopyranose mutase
MLQFMNKVTDKPNWHIKVKDDSLAEKWKVEAMQQINFTGRMATYCVGELRWRAEKFEKTGLVFVYNGDVVKSDKAVSEELKR